MSYEEFYCKFVTLPIILFSCFIGVLFLLGVLIWKNYGQYAGGKKSELDNLKNRLISELEKLIERRGAEQSEMVALWRNLITNYWENFIKLEVPKKGGRKFLERRKKIIILISMKGYYSTRERFYNDFADQYKVDSFFRRIGITNYRHKTIVTIKNYLRFLILHLSKI